MLAKILTTALLIAVSLSGCRGFIEGGSSETGEEGSVGEGGGSIETGQSTTTVIKGRIVLPASPDASINKTEEGN